VTHPRVAYPREPDTPVSHLPFSPAVVVGDLIFVSGQASVDATGKIVSDTFEGEFRRSMENVRLVLEGGSWTDPDRRPARAPSSPRARGRRTGPAARRLAP